MMNLSRCLSVAALVACAGVAQAHEYTFSINLSGAAEAPPNASPGTGIGTAVLDLDLATLTLHVEFAGLIGNTTASHIHGPTAVPFAGTAGVMTTTPTFVGFPLGVKSGTYDVTLDLASASSYNPSFITASGGTVAQAYNRLAFAILDGKSYLNIHTSAFPGGEIRGFLVPTPGVASAFVLAGAFAARRRR